MHTVEVNHEIGGSAREGIPRQTTQVVLLRELAADAIEGRRDERTRQERSAVNLAQNRFGSDCAVG